MNIVRREEKKEVIRKVAQILNQNLIQVLSLQHLNIHIRNVDLQDIKKKVKMKERQKNVII